MAQQETGHAKNLANFNKLIAICEGHAATYNPSNAALAIAELKKVSADVQTAVDAVSTQKVAFDHATAARSAEFAKLTNTTIRVINMLGASGVDDKTIAQAKTLSRKLQGQRANKAEVPLNDDGTPETKRISVSQMSFDSRLENLSKLITFLMPVTKYAPNETELSLAGLKAYHDDLEIKNNEAINANVFIYNARTNRNKLMYKNEPNLVNLANDIKKYIKAIFGTSSKENKQIVALRFSVPKNI